MDLDGDLDALRSAVLATLKPKNGSDKVKINHVTRTDDELEVLRKAALKSTKKQSENSQPVKNFQLAADFGIKKFNRNDNLIVIQPVHSEEKFEKNETSYYAKELKTQDAFDRTDNEQSSGSPRILAQHKTKGTDKFSRFESSSSSEDESDYSVSGSSSSAKLSETNDTKSVGDNNTSDEIIDDEDILVLQPDESFDENIEKPTENTNDNIVNSDNKKNASFPSEANNQTLSKKMNDDKRKRSAREDRSSRIKRHHKEDSDGNFQRRHKKHDRDRGANNDRRLHRRTKDRERREEERRKENTESLSRNRDDSRVKISSILSKPASDERSRSFSREATKSNLLERNSKSNDLREKLKSRKRSGDDDEEVNEQLEPKRRSRQTSEDRKSPPIKSVLSVVKLTSTVVDNSSSRKKVNDNTSVNCTLKSSDSGKSNSPLRPETSPERKVLIRSQAHKYASDDDRGVRRESAVAEEPVRRPDSRSSSPSSKQKLPVHLRLGNISTSSSNSKHSSSGDRSDRKRKSLSPSKLSDAPSSVKDVNSGGERNTKSRQVVKLSGERKRSLANILSKHSSTDRISTNKVQLAGKTFENELDEKIRRIRANNLAIMKRKSEIERERHSNG